MIIRKISRAFEPKGYWVGGWRKKHQESRRGLMKKSRKVVECHGEKMATLFLNKKEERQLGRKVFGYD